MKSRHNYFDWSEDVIAQLKSLYAQGLSFTKISQTLGCTRPSAIAKAQRLGITDRGSPVKKTEGGSRARKAEVKAARIRELREQALRYNRIEQVECPIVLIQEPDGRPGRPESLHASAHVDDLSDLPGFSNYWLSWENRWRFGGWSSTVSGLWQPKDCQFMTEGSAGSRPHFTSCGGEVVPGKSYCQGHLQRCSAKPEEVKK